MEKQKMEERTMEESNKKNPDSERKSKLVSAILMAFVCILMMGGGTYAWFTMGNTAMVKSLQLKVASEGTLYIGTSQLEAEGKTKNSVDWPAEKNNKVLYPATTADGKTMKKPVYTTETTVGSVDTITDDEKETYVIEQDFYLFMDEGTVDSHKDYNVHLVKNNPSESNGTYFTNNNAGLCARVSFEVDDVVVAVYEPNSNGTIANGTKATDNSGAAAYASKHQQTTDGNFISVAAAAADKAASVGDSDKLFTITGNAAKKVTMRVWFEGTDPQCCNEIKLIDIVGQFKFVASPKTN